MKSAAAFYVLAGIFAVLAFPATLTAQEKTVSYAGAIEGARDVNCRDLLPGTPLNIDIEDNSIKGFMQNLNGNRQRIEGELRGANIVAKSGYYSISGSFEGDTIRLRVSGTLCNYSAVLKKAVSYVGKLGLGVSSSGRSCSLNGSDIQIGVQGEEIKGTRKSPTGTLNRFEGKLQGANFTITTKDRQGNETTLNGTVEADKIQLKLNQSNCGYDAVMNKQS